MRQELIEDFGVLRRPQTNADRDPQLLLMPFRISQRLQRTHKNPPPGLEQLLRRFGYAQLDQSLVRVVSLPRFDAKLAFDPATWRPSASASRRSEGLNLVMRIGSAPTIPPAEEFGTGPTPTSVATLLAHGLTLSNGVFGTNTIDGVVVVHDGVARVTLRPIRLIQPPASLDPVAFGTVSTTVKDNVGAFQFPIPAATNRHMYTGTDGVPAIAEAIWYDASGNAIKQTTTNLDLLMAKDRGRSAEGSLRFGVGPVVRIAPAASESCTAHTPSNL